MAFVGREFFKLAICLLSIASTANSLRFGRWSWGRCPTLDIQQDFNITKYLGMWFEQAGYNLWSTEGNIRCVTANYKVNQTESVVPFENRGISNDTGKYVGGINGTAIIDDPSKNEGRLTVSFQRGWWTFTANYLVLGTDYKNYSVVFTCTNRLFFFHEYKVWFLSRDQLFSSGVQEQSFFDSTNKVLLAHNLDPSLLVRSSQANCVVSSE